MGAFRIGGLRGCQMRQPQPAKRNCFDTFGRFFCVVMFCERFGLEKENWMQTHAAQTQYFLQFSGSSGSLGRCRELNLCLFFGRLLQHVLQGSFLRGRLGATVPGIGRSPSGGDGLWGGRARRTC